MVYALHSLENVLGVGRSRVLYQNNYYSRTSIIQIPREEQNRSNCGSFDLESFRIMEVKKNKFE